MKISFFLFIFLFLSACVGDQNSNSLVMKGDLSCYYKDGVHRIRLNNKRFIKGASFLERGECFDALENSQILSNNDSGLLLFCGSSQVDMVADNFFGVVISDMDTNQSRIYGEMESIDGVAEECMRSVKQADYEKSVVRHCWPAQFTTTELITYCSQIDPLNEIQTCYCDDLCRPSLWEMVEWHKTRNELMQTLHIPKLKNLFVTKSACTKGLTLEVEVKPPTDPENEDSIL